MDRDGAIKLLKNAISELKMPRNSLLNGLDRKEPTIYLFGKSATGKTTFLNALLNRQKDEFFTSSNVSTQSEFRFIYGKEPAYKVEDDDKQGLPQTYNERKKLFAKINREGKKIVIELPEAALSGRKIVDIPGILDYAHKGKYLSEMIEDADIVCFFTPCIGKIDRQEYDILREISAALIPIILLFTMSDITEPDEGITRKTLPEFIGNRLDTEFVNIEISAHFMVSAIDYYKGREKHGINDFIDHIKLNEKKYLENAIQGRLRRLYGYYIKYLEDRVIGIGRDVEDLKYLISRENEIWYENEMAKIKNEEKIKKREIDRELMWLKRNIKQQLFGVSLNKVKNGKEKNDRQSRINYFIAMWKDYWSRIQSYDVRALPDIPTLPPIPNALFNELYIDKNKLNILEKKIFDSDYRDKKIEIKDIVDIGINLSNAAIIFSHIMYFRELSQIMDDKEKEILIRVENLTKEKEKELKEVREKKTKDAISENDIVKRFNIYKNHLEKLKKVTEYAN